MTKPQAWLAMSCEICCEQSSSGHHAKALTPGARTAASRLKEWDTRPKGHIA